MEIIGWITVILLCVLALFFIFLELGPIIHSEISSWSIKKERNIQIKKDKIAFKKAIREINYKTKTLNSMRKNNLISDEEFSYMNSIAILPEEESILTQNPSNNLENIIEEPKKPSNKKSKVKKHNVKTTS